MFKIIRGSIKKSYMHISETKELMRYGEEVMAIENILENLYESSLNGDEYAIELIRKVFNGKVPKRIEKILNSFMGR